MISSNFNLTEEQWICLLSKEGDVKKKGLKDVFTEAQDFLDLGGELRLQDMAVLRLLIAISVTLLYRYDENGEKIGLNNWIQARERYKAIWKAGRFNPRAVSDYFAEWYDRFNLFDENHPFFQIPLKNLTWADDKDFPEGKKPVYPNGVYMNWLKIANINGRIQSSRNKPDAPYKDLSGIDADEMSFDEAARWLLFYNTYADCTVGKRQHYKDASGKQQSANAGMTLPSRGALVTPVGRNLFETIMLNSVLFDPDRHEMFDSVCPVWEEETGSPAELVIEKPVPNDLARMYTQQGRRLSLVREGDKVTGIYASAGESYGKDLLWMEPAFMMHEVKDKDSKKPMLVPMQRSSETDVWRELEHITGEKGARITRWVDLLYGDDDDGIISEDNVIPFRITGISYGSMNCGIQAMTEDRIVLSRQFLEDSDLQSDACDEIEAINNIARIVRSFGNDCAQCMNFSGRDNRIGKALAIRHYEAVGQEFRKYLSGNSTIDELREAKISLAKKTVNTFVEQSIKALLRGKSGESGMFLGKAEAKFNSGLSKLERRENGK